MLPFAPPFQRMQLDIILTSLQDHTHVASLLGYSSPSDATDVSLLCISYGTVSAPTDGAPSHHTDTHLAEILMKTLLRNLGFYTVRSELVSANVGMGAFATYGSAPCVVGALSALF